MAGLVRHSGRRGAVLPGWSDTVRPVDVPDPGRAERATAQPEPAPGRCGPGRPDGLVGTPGPRSSAPRGELVGRTRHRPRAGGGPSAGPTSSSPVSPSPSSRSWACWPGRPGRSSITSWRSRAPWTPGPGSGWRDWSPQKWPLPERPPGSCWFVVASSYRTLRRLLAAVLVVDLALFNVFVINAPITEAAAQANGPAPAALAARVGDGRFIVYDPDRFDTDQLQDLGQTDLNIYHRLPSAQGYTALTDGGYYDATGAHYQEDLDPKTLAGTVWDQLNTTTLLSLPSYFLRPAPGAGPPLDPVPGRTSRRLGPELPRQDLEPRATSTTALDRGQARTWYFGGVLTVSRWPVPIQAEAGRTDLRRRTGHAHRHRPMAARRRCRRGRVREPALLGGVRLPRPVAAGGVVVRSVGPGPSSALPTAETAETGAVELDGAMQYGVVPPHWVFAGTWAPSGSSGTPRPRDGPGWSARKGGADGRPSRSARATVAAPEDGREPADHRARRSGRGPGAERVVEPGLARHHPGPGNRRAARHGCGATGGRRPEGHGPTGGDTGAGGVPGALHLPDRSWVPVATDGLGRGRGGPGGVGGDGGGGVPTPPSGQPRRRVNPGSARAEEPDGVGGPSVGGRGHGAGLLGPCGQDGRYRARVGGQGGPSLAHRAEQFDQGLGHIGLQVPVALVGAGPPRAGVRSVATASSSIRFDRPGWESGA